jgi:hypothetical protein
LLRTLLAGSHGYPYTQMLPTSEMPMVGGWCVQLGFIARYSSHLLGRRLPATWPKHVLPRILQIKDNFYRKNLHTYWTSRSWSTKLCWRPSETNLQNETTNENSTFLILAVSTFASTIQSLVHWKLLHMFQRRRLSFIILQRTPVSSFISNFFLGIIISFYSGKQREIMSMHHAPHFHFQPNTWVSQNTLLNHQCPILFLLNCHKLMVRIMLNHLIYKSI